MCGNGHHNHNHEQACDETKRAGRNRNFDGQWRKTPGRVIGTMLIRGYQLTLSSFIGNSCRHMPTCSEYAYEAIARHGLWSGGWLGLFRIVRCGPFGTHGFDPVPKKLKPEHRWYLPWRFWRSGVKDQ